MKTLFPTSLGLLLMAAAASSCSGQTSRKPAFGQPDSVRNRGGIVAPAPNTSNPPVVKPDTHQTTPMPTVVPPSDRTNMPVVKPQPGVQPK